jgi:MFS family permease
METKQGFWTPTNVLVSTYTFCWGFASLDRLLIAMLFPFVIPYFHMNFAQAGLIMTCMSIVYLIMASLGGALSDKYGRKKVILPSVIIFSLCSFLTGLAVNFATLIGIRSVIGGAEGAFYTSGGAQIAEQAPNESRGTAIGIYNSAFPLFGACLAPIYAPYVASHWGWQWACYLTIIPGVLLAYIISSKVHDTHAALGRRAAGAPPRVPWRVVFKDKNIILSALFGAMWFVWLWSWLSFGMLFFTKVRGLTTASAGLTLAALGLGGAVGGVVMARISDTSGRKPTLIIGTLIGIAGTLVVLLIPTLPLALIAVVLFVTATATWGNAPLFLQVIPSDCVTREHLAKTIGIVVAIGELVGIAVAPPILGAVGDKWGLTTTMFTGVASLVVALLLACALRESYPKAQARRAAQTARA